MDSESDKTRRLGCWDGPGLLGPFMKQWATDEPTPSFEPPDAFCDKLISVGFNNRLAAEHDFWSAVIKASYQGDEGRRRINMATISLVERDSLHFKLPDIRCPVLWIHVCSEVTLVVITLVIIDRRT